MPSSSSIFNWSSTNDDSNLGIIQSLPKLKQVNNSRSGRYYQIEEGDSKLVVQFFSVTTILSDDPEKKKSLEKWRNQIGREKAKEITKTSANRGTKLHSLIESYIKGELDNNNHNDPVLQWMFNAGKGELAQNITRVRCLEQRLFSKRLGIAGTVDGVIDWNGVPSIIDFKSSRKIKQREWIDDYFSQGTAYSLMWKEHTGEFIDQVIIFIMVEGEPIPQIFKETIDIDMIASLYKKIHGFYSRRQKDTSFSSSSGDGTIYLPEIFREEENTTKK